MFSLRLHTFGGGANRQPVCADTLPFLDQHSVGLEEAANAVAFPARDFFQNRRQHREGTAAQHGALRDLRNIRRLGDGNRESVARVDVQDNVNVGTAVAGVNHVIGAGDLLQKQLIQNRDFAIAGGGAHDGVDLAGRLVAKFRAEDAIGRNNIFQRRENDLNWCSRENIKIELVAVDARIEKLVKKLDVSLETN